MPMYGQKTGNANRWSPMIQPVGNKNQWQQLKNNNEYSYGSGSGPTNDARYKVGPVMPPGQGSFVSPQPVPGQGYKTGNQVGKGYGMVPLRPGQNRIPIFGPVQSQYGWYGGGYMGGDYMGGGQLPNVPSIGPRRPWGMR